MQQVESLEAANRELQSIPNITNVFSIRKISINSFSCLFPFVVRVTLVALLCATVSCMVLCPGATDVLKGTTLVSTPR